MEDLAPDGPPVVVLQDGPDVLWLVNSNSTLPAVVESTAQLVQDLAVPRRLPRHLALLRRLVAPICRRVHSCD
ncbi:MAG: hypothetical protein ACXV3V_11055 [Actinomycetes bacterium]